MLCGCNAKRKVLTKTSPVEENLRTFIKISAINTC